MGCNHECRHPCRLAGFIFIADPWLGELVEGVGSDDCGLEPVAASAITLHIGASPVIASCGSRVRVNGLEYHVGVGRWLDEDALKLREYAPITHANDTLVEPIAFALHGINPDVFLVMRGDGVDDLGPMGPFMALWRDLPSVPPALCHYADPNDPQFPSECDP